MTNENSALGTNRRMGRKHVPNHECVCKFQLWQMKALKLVKRCEK